jgi:hypothetical protein
MLSEQICSSNTVGDLKETERELKKIFSKIFNFTLLEIENRNYW